MSRNHPSGADRDTNLNAEVGAEHKEDRRKCAMRELREMSDRANAETGPVSWTRDDVHDRKPS